MKMYEIFYELENGNWNRETVYGKESMKQRVKELKPTRAKIRVYNEYGYRKRFI